VIDAQSLKLLRDLPDDLLALGWEFSLQESGKSHALANPAHKAVYARRFERGSVE